MVDMPLDVRHAQSPDRPSGSLGCRGDVPALPRRADGGVEPEGRLRSGLRRGSPGTVPQGDAEPRLWARRGHRHSWRFGLGCAGAGAGDPPQCPRRARRLHDRQRRLISLDRRRESLVSAAGQGLLAMRGTRSDSRHGRRAARCLQPGDPADDPPRWDGSCSRTPRRRRSCTGRSPT